MAKKTTWYVTAPNGQCGKIEAKTAQEVANLLISQGYTPAGHKVQLYHE